MLRSRSMRVEEVGAREPKLWTSDVAKQPSVKGMFIGGMREKLGKAVAKFLVMNNVSVNELKDHFFKNMIQVAVSMDHGDKLPTPKDIHGKYLDEFVNEAKNYVQSLQPIWESWGIHFYVMVE